MSLLRRTFASPSYGTTPLLTPTATLLHQNQSQLQQSHLRLFSSTPPKLKKKSGKQKRDRRITAIRYFLHHPLNPRPLRFSRTRFLRHWTIHRAWQRYTDRLRQQRQLELERQYNSMVEACEQLRLIDGEGLTHQERIKYGQKPLNLGKTTEAGMEEKGANEEDIVRGREGRLYRMAMLKKGIWAGVPIEYARIQTETPAREGWNHAWTR